MSDTATETAHDVRDDLKVGGRYTAIDNGDGTYNILDIPIFTEIPAGVKRNKEPIGKVWQDKAFIRNRERESEGHLPPVHIYHSDEETIKPIYAGKWRSRAVRQFRYQGQLLWTTFGDILGMPAAIFLARVKPGFLPYRSVEIHNWDSPEIDSVALMDTDVPFFRLPMTTIGTVVRKEAEYFRDGTRPPYACVIGKAPAMAILFRFDEEKPANKDKKKKPGEPGKKPGDGIPEKPPAAADGGEREDLDQTPETAETEPGMEPGDEAGEEVEEQDLAADTALIAEIRQLRQIVTQLQQRLGPQPPPEDKVEPVDGYNIQSEPINKPQSVPFKEENMAETKPPVTPPAAPPAPAPAPVMMKAEDVEAIVMRAVQKAVIESTTPLQAELTAIKAERAEEKKTAKTNSLFRSAVESLESNRQSVDENTAKILMKAAEIGEDFLKQQVDVFKARLPKDPPSDHESFEEEHAGSAAANQEGDLVNKFLAKPERAAGAAWAKDQLVAFRAWKKSYPNTEITAEEWLEDNWRAENMYQVNKV